MTKHQRELTPTNLIAFATDFLEKNSYRFVGEAFKEWNSTTSRLFEDVYSVVGVVVFQTCADLIASWPKMQGSMVDVMSQKVGRLESKAWDGYLVLLTPGQALSSIDTLDSIRNDTTRLRKLVATGDDLESLSDVERLLSALLPLAMNYQTAHPESVLHNLDVLLEKQGVSTSVTSTLVKAFLESRSPMEALHNLSEEQ